MLQLIEELIFYTHWQVSFQVDCLDCYQSYNALLDIFLLLKVPIFFYTLYFSIQKAR
jgi:hypothetical protein